MAIETKEKTVGGRRYMVTNFPAFKGLDVFEMLSTVAGPAMASMAAGGPDAKIETAAALMFSRLGGGKLRALASELLCCVEVIEGNRKHDMLIGFDVEYAGKLWDVFQVMAFVVEVNFADFYAGLLAMFASHEAPASPSASPTT